MLSRLRNPWVFISLLCITATSVFFSFFWSSAVHFLGAQKPSFCACHKCLTGGDLWFRQLVSSSPIPFLSRQSPTSEDAFNWWKVNVNLFNNTQYIFCSCFTVSGFGDSDRCRTCAVVGNSGNLKGSHYGPLIDFHDIVIRMNRAPIKGYEKDVGTKTTYHAMYPESAISLDNSTRLVFFPFKINDFLWLLKRFTHSSNTYKFPVVSHIDVMILNPAFMKYVHKRWLGNKGRYPSTGFLTVALSMYICDEVSVFGFGADRDGNWNHYFEILKNKRLRTGPHAGTHEYEFIQQLHKMQKIRFFKGW
uniref:ST3 beta-galactoside alpha-2,3-sialyltransferase 1 n=1 Tax=Monopterus albus TaxID=43700 RepID=A0A3Q3QMK5_MONAL